MIVILGSLSSCVMYQPRLNTRWRKTTCSSNASAMCIRIQHAGCLHHFARGAGDLLHLVSDLTSLLGYFTLVMCFKNTSPSAPSSGVVNATITNRCGDSGFRADDHPRHCVKPHSGRSTFVWAPIPGLICAVIVIATVCLLTPSGRSVAASSTFCRMLSGENKMLDIDKSTVDFLVPKIWFRKWKKFSAMTFRWCTHRGRDGEARHRSYLFRCLRTPLNAAQTAKHLADRFSDLQFTPFPAGSSAITPRIASTIVRGDWRF